MTTIAGLIALLPEKMYASTFGLGYGAFSVFFGLGTKIAENQAQIWTDGHATLNGHPAAFSYGILLLSYVGLVQVPAAALGVWAIKNDKERIQRAVAEAGPLLERKTGSLLEGDGTISSSGCCSVVCGV